MVGHVRFTLDVLKESPCVFFDINKKLIEALNGFHGLMISKATLPRLMVQKKIGSSQRSNSSDISPELRQCPIT